MELVEGLDSGSGGGAELGGACCLLLSYALMAFSNKASISDSKSTSS